MHASRSTKKTIEISSYVVSADWSGDLDTAARKVELSIACNHQDKSFTNVDIANGDSISIYSSNDSTGGILYQIFDGIVFSRSRNTSTKTYEITIYDKLIYLAKSKVTRKFVNITVSNIIRQVANENNLSIGDKFPTIGIYCNFIADNISYTEIIQKAFELATAQNGKHYHIYIDNGKLNVVERGSNDSIIANYIASDSVNVEYTSHSESIEDMINSVAIVNDNGDEIGRVNNDAEVSSYGKLQAVYKIDSKQDTQTSAKALLKSISYKSSLNGIGNINCITGFTIMIQEEQLKGLFMILADRHSISNNIHKMELELEFLKVAM